MNIPILMHYQIDSPMARGTPLRSLVVSPVSFARQKGLLSVSSMFGGSSSWDSLIGEVEKI